MRMRQIFYIFFKLKTRLLWNRSETSKSEGQYETKNTTRWPLLKQKNEKFTQM